MHMRERGLNCYEFDGLRALEIKLLLSIFSGNEPRAFFCDCFGLTFK